MQPTISSQQKTRNVNQASRFATNTTNASQAMAPTAPSSRPSGHDAPVGDRKMMLQTCRSSLAMTPCDTGKQTPIQNRERRTRAQRRGENFDTVGDLNGMDSSALKYTYEWQDREVGMFQN